MSTTPTKARPRNAPIDPPLLKALLLFMANTNQDSVSEDLGATVATARRILAHPHAFDESSDTPDVHRGVLESLRWTSGLPEDDKAHNDLIDAIRRADREPFTARSEHAADVLVMSIERAALVGAAIMFDLLRGR